MSNKDQQKINQLKQTEDVDNLSMATQLLIGKGSTELEAVELAGHWGDAGLKPVLESNTLIGIATSEVERGIVLVSFNAG